MYTKTVDLKKPSDNEDNDSNTVDYQQNYAQETKMSEDEVEDEEEEDDDDDDDDEQEMEQMEDEEEEAESSDSFQISNQIRYLDIVS